LKSKKERYSPIQKFEEKCMCVCYNPRIVSRDRAFHIQILLCSLLRTAVLLCFLLHLFPLSYACDEELRTVSIKVAADEEFRSQSDWQLKAKRLISRSSARFKNEFSIRFHIEKFVFWNSDNSADSLFELLHDLRKKISHEGCDVVMGLTSQGQQGMEFEYSGIAAYLNSTVLLRELPSESTMERMMAHEFGHLFGAADLHEKGSLMDEEKPGEKFDTFTRSLIVLNKQRDFNPYVFPLSEGKLDKAAALYKKRKSLGLREDSVGMLLAVFYLEMEDYSSMMEECLDLIGKNPDSPEAHNLMGIVLRRTGRIDEAVVEYEKALALQARFPELHYNLGIALMKKGLLEKAIGEFKEAVRLYPRYAKAYVNLGHVYVEMNRADDAERECRRALEINPRSSEALSTLGAALILKENYEEAERISHKALEINPRLFGPHNSLGSIYVHCGRIDEAVNEYKTAIKMKSDYPEAHYNLGRAYFLKGMLGEARKEFLEAVRLRPDYDKAYCSLAAVFLRLDELDQAVRECRSALEINPDNSVAHFNLAHALYRQGSYKQAEKECRKSMVLGLEVPQCYSLLGIILEETGKRREARKQFLKALDLNPQFVEAHLNLANLYFKDKNFSKSEAHYKKVLKIHPLNGQVCHYLALVYFYLKDYDLSLAYVKKAEGLGIIVNPDFKKDLFKKIGKKIYQ